MLTTIAAIAGLIFGFTGLVISILNYRRDRARVVVSLRWDRVVRDKDGRLGHFVQVRIANTGRRAVYLTSIGIELWSEKPRHHIQKTRVGVPVGRKLAEGDPLIILVVPDSQETAEMLYSHAKSWRRIRAFAEDSSGRKYVSDFFLSRLIVGLFWQLYRPKWGEGNGKAPLKDLLYSWTMECDREWHEFESQLLKGEKQNAGLVKEVGEDVAAT